MTSLTIYNNVIDILARDLGLEHHYDLSEDQILAILTQRVDDLLQSDRDLLMSYLYRLDVPQSQIMAVLRVTNIIPPEESLARLILDRQIKRVKTKLKYKQDPIKGWEF